MIHLIDLLIDVKVFPVKLAQKIGLEESVVFYYLLKTKANTEFDFVDTFSSSFGIRNIKKCLDNLKTCKLLEQKITGKYKLNIDNLEYVLYGNTPKTDTELELAISKFIEMCKSKGRSRTRFDILEMIRDVDRDKALQCLNYSTSNKFITLIWPNTNEKHSGHSQKPKTGKSGGSAQGSSERQNFSEKI